MKIIIKFYIYLDIMHNQLNFYLVKMHQLLETFSTNLESWLRVHLRNQSKITSDFHQEEMIAVNL